ncbi:phenylalanine--tRNA ligase subunit alpha [Facklamia sp. DSM 111018]|uniref:Phenylalanine--tRNA ligase alpha subunit n=1 Tax=Facklamia lactis TaxID=2749967 RepID=A0ABS0LSC7_9LACT|nr:phenylalanine--tRNA ligase subunit alpha [Facklamia lactis]MBG9981242.1 phenylalanine--tRNA ligase subunit alpha [Facklamia lactis]MBG9987044.1 phenylalanine--tRNA ligase subunit alpha [Facklamia lactis]
MIKELQEQVHTLIEKALEDIKQASSSQELQDLRVNYTGKKGELTKISKKMKDLDKEEKPQLGQFINQFHTKFNEAFDLKQKQIAQEELQAQLAKETIDVTLPGRIQSQGVRHILTQTREELEDLFLGMGYQIIEGPEVELDTYNFERMNLPRNHPARDMQDTFYISEEVLLRTHTSPVQARTLEQHNFEKDGPLKMVSPGKVFRRDTDDATHSHQFHQMEGLVVAPRITLADLKGTLLQFAKAFFGEEREIRLRPSFFSFTEPSVEVDVSCFKCGGEGCSICKQTGWIEVLGAGIVHPNVLEMSGVDAERYSGFAFGVGIDRVAMLKYNIDDIRHFYQNDLRFLNQFKGGQN